MGKLRSRFVTVSLGFLLAILFTSQLGSALIARADVLMILTVSTNKSEYGRGETVTVQGTLKLGKEPVGDGVVGIQVNKPNGDFLTVRTSTTGSSGGTWNVEILQFYTSDSLGNPKSSFQRGTLAWFTMVVRNNLDADRNLALVLTTLYSNMVPYRVRVPLQLQLPPGNQTFYISEPIPTDAVLGQYIVFTNAFNELPALNGYAYCPEKSASYNVTSTTFLALANDIEGQAFATTSIDGSYSMNIRLSTSATIGNYTVYAGSYYQNSDPPGQHSTATSTFKVILVGDVNQDGAVEGRDMAIAAKAFGTSIGEPGYVPNADLNNDGMIEGKDVAIIAKHFGESG